MFIETIEAREILDSRGNPTVHVTVVLEDGAAGIARPFRRIHRRPRGCRTSRWRQALWR